MECAPNGGWGVSEVGCFCTLVARVVSPTVRLVKDVLKLTVGAAAGTAVEVMTDGG